jgi:DNA-binding CsgD family transcriptional regulator
VTREILGVMEPSGVRAEVRRMCRSAVDPLALYRGAAALLAPAVGFERWCGLLLDPATLMNTGGYHEEGLPLDVLPRLLEIEVGEVDANTIPALGRSEAGVSTLHRATDGRPSDSRRYREVLEPAGLGREMRAVLRDRGSAWGGLVFFRATNDSDFTDAEVALVAGVGADLARAVRRCLLHSEHAYRDQPSGPGMALLTVDDMDVRVEMVSGAARQWLNEVTDGRLQPSLLPLAVVTLAQRAVRAPDGRADVRLRARSGRWLTLYAEVMDEDVGEDPGAAAIHRVSLVVEPTRPHELAEVIGAAYALTPREREVARLAVAGCANREIAAALFLSVYTVQDHLKAIFTKLDVRNRAEMTSRMFFDQYLPRQQDGTPLGGDGWYITASGD